MINEHSKRDFDYILNYLDNNLGCFYQQKSCYFLYFSDMSDADYYLTPDCYFDLRFMYKFISRAYALRDDP